MTYVYVTYLDHVKTVAFSVPLYARQYAEAERKKSGKEVVVVIGTDARFESVQS